MATNILSIAKTYATSAEIAIDATTVATFFLKGKMTGGKVDVQIKDDLNNWTTLGQLNSDNKAYIINSPGTYRFVRYAGNSAGVSRG